jgi:hypothetical protein
VEVHLVEENAELMAFISKKVGVALLCQVPVRGLDF